MITISPTKDISRTTAKRINGCALTGRSWVLLMSGGIAVRIIGTKRQGGKRWFKTISGNWMTYDSFKIYEDYPR